MRAALAATLVARALADTPGPHPHDIHALSDLRHPAALENRPEELNVVAEQRDAVVTSVPIGAAAQAAGDDGKNLKRR